MSNRALLEQAFAYADGGQARGVDDIRKHLSGLGFSEAELHQLSGFAVSRQLLVRIRAASTKIG